MPSANAAAALPPHASPAKKSKEPAPLTPAQLARQEKWRRGAAELREKISPWQALSLAGFFTVMGIGAAIFGLLNNAEKKASASWPTTPGVITSCELQEVRSKPRRLPYEIVKYSVKVRYDYTVGGKLYEGRRIVFSDDLWELDSAQRRVAKYTVGTSHAVSYSPMFPSRSVLEPGDTYEGPTQSVDTILGVWLPLGLIPIVLMLLQIYRITKSVPAAQVRR